MRRQSPLTCVKLYLYTKYLRCFLVFLAVFLKKPLEFLIISYYSITVATKNVSSLLCDNTALKLFLRGVIMKSSRIGIAIFRYGEMRRDGHFMDLVDSVDLMDR